MVEFALLLPILLLVILGIAEAALFIQGYLAVQHAAREAARFAVTYQPVQGACLDQDGDGHIADGIDVTHDDGDDLAPYPACPYDYMAYPQETDEHYHARRMVLIKQKARQQAVGLRINDDYLGDTSEKYDLYKDEPRFFGVRVWGYPSFQADCNANPDQCLDHPGLEGLPVRVVVVHNVEVADPIYRGLREYLTVSGEAQMINEGIQVGFGDMPPPDFSTSPDLGETPIPTNTPEDSLTPEPTEAPLAYYVELDVESAINEMPGDREHEFVATVTDELGRRVQGARVSFSTDAGGFSYSGVDPDYTEEETNASGQAGVTLYGNRPQTANLQAWLDYDGDDTWDAGEPFDTAIKTWVFPEGQPYIVVWNHDVIPLGDITIDVMDHNPADNPHRLRWCVISGTDTSTVVQDALNVDAGGDAVDLQFEVPQDSEGLYRLETHSSSGGCGAGDLVAYSAAVRVSVIPPDLTMASFNMPDTVCPATLFTMSVVIENLSLGSTAEFFDVDFYVDPDPTPPQSPIGVVKQWVSGIGPNGTAVVNAVMWVESLGQHEIWVRVDTTDYIEEGDEDNNVGMVSFTTGSTGSSENTGWRSPTANYVYNVGLSEPERAYADGDSDGGRAYRDNDANNVSQVYRDYGFDIPDDATIEGIQVRLDWWLDYIYLSTSSIRVYLSWDGGTSWTDRRTASTERTSDGNPTDIEGGTGYTWGRMWSPSDFSDDNFCVRLVLITDSWQRDFRIDWVPVQVTYSRLPECEEGDDPPPWGEEGTVRPPGLVECQQLILGGDFEGNPDRVFSYWEAGGANAYQHQSRYFSDGSMSMRLHASMGSYPNCPALSPWLYQTVQIPDEVYTMTTMVVQGQRLVAGSLAPCSYPDTPEATDVLYLQMQTGGGSDLGSRIEIVNGGAGLETWESFEMDVTDEVDLVNRAGQQVRVRFEAEHDANYYDTWFYLDAIKCDVCTEWPIPDDESGTASIGGEVRVLVGGIPQTLQGVDVWAYSPGGEVYHTVTIQDGSYHFYNITPGTYTIYSEIWIGGGLRSVATTVTVASDERNYSVNLFLL